jgi:hypothetical protein
MYQYLSGGELLNHDCRCCDGMGGNKIGKCTECNGTGMIFNHNIIDQMYHEWDSYEDTWIIKMQSVGLIKFNLSEKEYNQLFDLLTHGEY